MNLRYVFEGAQAYVMLSRVKELEQVYILEDLPENKIYPIQEALVEIRRLEDVSINKNPTLWDREPDPNVIKISYLNARSLLNKFNNIKSDFSLQQSNVLVLAETWIPKNGTGCEQYELKNYDTHLNSTGRGKGMAVLYQPEYNQIRNHNEDNINITKIESEDLDIIAVYRSKDGLCDKLISKLQVIINMAKSTLVIGDMNICNKKNPNNDLKRFLDKISFRQIIREATHIEGGHLNHAYVLNIGNFEEIPDIQLIPKYYSDHDAICISWKKIDSKRN